MASFAKLLQSARKKGEKKEGGEEKRGRKKMQCESVLLRCQSPQNSSPSESSATRLHLLCNMDSLCIIQNCNRDF